LASTDTLTRITKRQITYQLKLTVRVKAATINRSKHSKTYAKRKDRQSQV